MDEVLLDTDVFSFLLRPHDTRATLYRPYLLSRTIVISFITVGELYYWAARKNWGFERVKLLESRMEETLVVPYHHEVCRAYAMLRSGVKTPQGSHRVIGDNDLWIAACAVRHGIPLVTHNRRHFDGIPGLNIISQAP